MRGPPARNLGIGFRPRKRSLSRREREGPDAKRWEGEGVSICPARAEPLILPRLRRGPLLLPLREGSGVRGEELQDGLAVAIQLGLADAGDAAERRQRGRLGARDLGQGSVLEDDVG